MQSDQDYIDRINRDPNLKAGLKKANEKRESETRHSQQFADNLHTTGAKTTTKPVINYEIPEEYKVKIYPTIGLKSSQKDRSSAYRVWVVAQYANEENGSGKISRSRLWNILSSLGVTERKRRRWISQALRVGLMFYDPKKKNYYLKNQARVAVIYGVTEIGLPKDIDIRELVKPGWSALLWGMVLSNYPDDIPRGRKVLEQLTGIAERTQRKLEAQLKRTSYKVIKKKNHVKTNIRADIKTLNGYREEINQASFGGKDGVIFVRKPDIRRVSNSGAFRRKHLGRTWNIQKEIKSLSIVADNGPSLSEDWGKESNFKLFYDTRKGARSAARRYSKMDYLPGDGPNETFYISELGRNNNILRAVQVHDSRAYI